VNQEKFEFFFVNALVGVFVEVSETLVGRFPVLPYFGNYMLQNGLLGPK
jgi:hypothetical protein